MKTRKRSDHQKVCLPVNGKKAQRKSKLTVTSIYSSKVDEDAVVSVILDLLSGKQNPVSRGARRDVVRDEPRAKADHRK